MSYALLTSIAAVLHGIWEYLHLPLYRDYESLGAGMQLIAYATAGDVAYTLLIAGTIALARGRGWWRKEGGGDYVAAAFLGFLVALFVEYKALYLHRWSYAAAMPIIPLLGVGLSPIAQMTILTPIAIWLARVVMRSGESATSSQV